MPFRLSSWQNTSLKNTDLSQFVNLFLTYNSVIDGQHFHTLLFFQPVLVDTNNHFRSWHEKLKGVYIYWHRYIKRYKVNEHKKPFQQQNISTLYSMLKKEIVIEVPGCQVIGDQAGEFYTICNLNNVLFRVRLQYFAHLPNPIVVKIQDEDWLCEPSFHALRLSRFQSNTRELLSRSPLRQWHHATHTHQNKNVRTSHDSVFDVGNSWNIVFSNGILKQDLWQKSENLLLYPLVSPPLLHYKQLYSTFQSSYWNLWKMLKKDPKP